MADGIVVEIRGLDQLAANLRSIPALFSQKIIREALHAAGDVIASAAEVTAAAHHVTGELEADIVTKVRVDPQLSDNYVLVGPGYDRGQLTVKGTRTNKRGKVEAVVDSSESPGVYGLFLEIGHKQGTKAEFGGADVPPHPWLRPAFEMSKEAAVGVFIAYVRGGLEAVAAALPKGGI